MFSFPSILGKLAHPCPVRQAQVDWGRDRLSEHVVGDRPATEPGGGGVRPRRDAAGNGDRRRHRGSWRPTSTATPTARSTRLRSPSTARGSPSMRSRSRTSSTSAASSSAWAARRRSPSSRPSCPRPRTPRLRADRQGDGDASWPRACRSGDPASRTDASRRDDRPCRPRRADGVRLAQERVSGDFAHIHDLLNESFARSCTCTRQESTSQE